MGYQYKWVMAFKTDNYHRIGGNYQFVHILLWILKNDFFTPFHREYIVMQRFSATYFPTTQRKVAWANGF